MKGVSWQYHYVLIWKFCEILIPQKERNFMLTKVLSSYEQITEDFFKFAKNVFKRDFQVYCTDCVFNDSFQKHKKQWFSKEHLYPNIQVKTLLLKHFYKIFFQDNLKMPIVSHYLIGPENFLFRNNVLVVV